MNPLFCFSIHFLLSSCTSNPNIHSFVSYGLHINSNRTILLSYPLFQTGPKDVSSDCTVEAAMEEDYKMRMGFVVKTCPFTNSILTLWTMNLLGTS